MRTVLDLLLFPLAATGSPDDLGPPLRANDFDWYGAQVPTAAALCLPGGGLRPSATADPWHADGRGTRDWYLRPGDYLAVAACAGATIMLMSHGEDTRVTLSNPAWLAVAHPHKAAAEAARDGYPDEITVRVEQAHGMAWHYRRNRLLPAAPPPPGRRVGACPAAPTGGRPGPAPAGGGAWRGGGRGSG